MESFTETKDRRDNKKKMQYVPKRGGPRGGAGGQPRPEKQTEDVHMKEEQPQSQRPPRRGGKAHEEEKKAGHKQSHRPSTEEGFTGDKETWFDGKQSPSHSV